MTEPLNSIKLKIALLGDEGVGKTSLIHRFVSGVFDPSYIRTLGVVVSKKTIEVDAPARGSATIHLTVYDLMGQESFLRLFKGAYFQGVQGILAVFDLTRSASLRALPRWIDAAREVVGPVAIYALGNKVDLAGQGETSEEQISRTLGPYRCPILRTSAKTGANIEEAFRGLTGSILASLPDVETLEYLRNRRRLHPD